MLDARFVRENIDAVKEALNKRGYEFPLSHFLAIDEKRMALLRDAEELRNKTECCLRRDRQAQERKGGCLCACLRR